MLIKNIRVNSIHPSYIETPLIAYFDVESIKQNHPFGRLCSTDEIAQLVTFYCRMMQVLLLV